MPSMELPRNSKKITQPVYKFLLIVTKYCVARLIVKFFMGSPGHLLLPLLVKSCLSAGFRVAFAKFRDVNGLPQHLPFYLVEMSNSQPEGARTSRSQQEAKMAGKGR